MFGIKKLKEKVATLSRAVNGRGGKWWEVEKGLVGCVKDLEGRVETHADLLLGGKRPVCACEQRVAALECLQKHGEHLWRFGETASWVAVDGTIYKFICYRCAAELWMPERTLTPAQRAELEALEILPKAKPKKKGK